MKSMRISEDILSLARFKSHASEMIRKLNEQQRPIVIVQNGQPAAVLVTPEEYDRMNEQGRFMAAIEEGLTDADQGRVVEDEALTKLLDTRLGTLPEAE